MKAPKVLGADDVPKRPPPTVEEDWVPKKLPVGGAGAGDAAPNKERDGA